MPQAETKNINKKNNKKKTPQSDIFLYFYLLIFYPHSVTAITKHYNLIKWKRQNKNSLKTHSAN